MNGSHPELPVLTRAFPHLGSSDPSGHRRLLGQALANLRDNAVRYSPRGGQSRMSVGRIDDAADLTVADSGPGIPAEDRERVLERFVRLDTSRGAPGSG